MPLPTHGVATLANMRTYPAVVVLTVALAACSSGAKDSAGSSGEAFKPGDAGAKAPAAAPASLTKSTALARYVVRTGSVTVGVRDVPAASRDAVGVAERAGGYVEGERTTLATGTSLTLRVPPERFTATLDAIGALGEVAERTVTTTDVTGDVADVDGRLAAARTSTARLRSFLGKAETVSEVTALEGELSQREADYESLTSRRRALGEQTTYATVTANLRPAADVERPRHEAKGFAGGLRNGWRAFTATVAVLLVVAGAGAPFAAVAAVVAVPLLLRRRRLRAAT